MRRLLVIACGLVVAAHAAPAALAHANVVSTVPRDGQTVAVAPAEVRVMFDDPVRAGPGNAVVSADGRSVQAGSPRVGRDGRELVLPLGRLQDGDYSVRWRIVSDDGHLESGVLAFRIGPPRPGPGRPAPARAVAAIGADLGQ
jgi:methionine-rich copper-binding protein CopC